MKKDWLTVRTIDLAMTGYLCFVAGIIIGLALGNDLSWDRLLALAGGGAGAIMAVGAAVYFEHRKRRTRRREEISEVVDHLDFVLNQLPTTSPAASPTGNNLVPFAAEYEAAGRSVSHLAKEVLATTEQFSFPERMAMRALVEVADDAEAKARPIVAKGGGTQADGRRIAQAATNFRSAMNHLIRILQR